MEQLGSHGTDFYYAIWYWSIFENLSRKLKFYYNLKSMTSAIREDQYTYLAEFLLEWETVQTNVLEEIEKRFIFNNFFLFSKIVPSIR